MMYSNVDTVHLKSVAVRFVSFYNRNPKTDLMHKQIIKLGAVLIFCREWYDLHNRSRPVIKIWKETVKVLEEGGIPIFSLHKIVQLSEESLIAKPIKWGSGDG